MFIKVPWPARGPLLPFVKNAYLGPHLPLDNGCRRRRPGQPSVLHRLPDFDEEIG